MKHPMAHKIKRPFAYTPSEATDIGARFARIRAEQKRAAEQAKADEAERVAVLAKRRIK